MLYIWLGILVFSLCMEAATTSLIAIWFSAGALAAMVFSVFTSNVIVQSLVFVGVSALLLLLYAFKWRKKLSKSHIHTNTEAIIGSVCLVEETIPENGRGRVKAGAQSWSAVSADNSEIPAGTAVEVLGIEGVKLICAKTDKQIFVTQK